MNSKRVYAAEQREKKIASYYYKIQQLIARVKLQPFEVDYSAELEKLHRDNPKDKTMILQAERDAYKAVSK
jgi:hypothetical protein